MSTVMEEFGLACAWQMPVSPRYPRLLRSLDWAESRLGCGSGVLSGIHSDLWYHPEVMNDEEWIMTARHRIAVILVKARREHPWGWGARRSWLGRRRPSLVTA